MKHVDSCLVMNAIIDEMFVNGKKYITKKSSISKSI